MFGELEEILIGLRQAYDIVMAVMIALGSMKYEESFLNALAAATEIMEKQIDALKELLKKEASPCE